MKQPSTGIPLHQLRRLAAISATAFALGAAATGALAQTYPAWAPDTYYTAGTVVTYNGRLYRATVNQTDYASTGWNPTNTSLWTDIGTTTGPSPAPAPSPTPPPTPAPSPAPAPSGNCAPVWVAATAYGGGAIASKGTTNYKANWWTQGNDPATNNGPAGSGQPWTSQGAYTTGPAPIPSPTPTPSPSPSPSPPPSPSPAPAPGLTDPAAKSATQAGRAYTVYYPSWSDNWFDATGKDLNQVFQASHFARIPANYTHVVAAFAQPNFTWGGMAANNWSGTGINFNGRPSDIKAAIDVLHARNIKVILAVGGATYNNWATLSAEGHAGSGPTITALANVMRDVGFDGLDVDYEIEGLDGYAGAVKAMRKAVDLAGGGRILSVAGWSTGADCTGATQNDPQCAGVGVSYWGGKAGLERQLVNSDPAMKTAFNLVNIMSYDARYEHYDGVTAWKQYRQLFPSSTIVSIGFETAPEGWAGGQLVVNNADAQCTGSVILQNSYGANINQPYSVERYLNAVVTSNLDNRNPRDGAMLWQALKTATGSCGSAPLASPGSTGRKVANTLGLVDDPALQNAPWK